MLMTMEHVVTQLQQEQSNSVLKWQQNLDLSMQCEQPTISRQPKFGRILRVSLMWKVLDGRKNSLDVKRISNSGRRRRRHSLLV